MGVYFDKKRNRWEYEFQLKGQRYNRDCLDAAGKPVTSKRAAEAAERQARHRAEIESKLALGASVTMGAVAGSLLKQWERGRDWANTRRYVAELLAFFGPDLPITKLDEERVAAYVDWALAQPARHWKGGARPRAQSCDATADLERTRSAATVNHYLVPLRQMVRRAAGMTDPLTGEAVLRIPPTIPFLKQPRRLPRPVPDDVIGRVLAQVPQHTAEAIFLTLYFGLRRVDVFGLQLRHVDFQARGLRYAAEEVKGARDELLPASDDALALLALLCGQARERGTPYLITWRRWATQPWRPITSSKRAWGRAMAAIEAELGARWRWHDLKAAFTTHLAMSGLPAEIVRRMSRHRHMSTTMAYMAAADEQMARAAEAASIRPALKLVRE